MNKDQNIYKTFSFKLSASILSVCILSLMALPIHAAENTNTSNQQAAMSEAVAALNVNKEAAVVRAAVEKELLSKVKINKVEMDAAVASVLRAPIYKVEPVLEYLTVIDGEILDLNYHASSAVLAAYLKLIRDDFLLDSEEQVTLLGKAFDNEFPFKHTEEFKKPVKLDKGWLLIRGKFFDDIKGLVFTTDDKGKITLIEYVLDINPEDYSYEVPTDIIR